MTEPMRSRDALRRADLDRVNSDGTRSPRVKARTIARRRARKARGR